MKFGIQVKLNGKFGNRRMKLLKETYSGKRVFVTGHTGFKGSWLIQILSLMGAKVKGYALAPVTNLNLFDELSATEFCESEINDLRNKGALLKSISDFQPDFVFHLAAQPLVRLSYDIPSETFDVNAIGTANLLDAIRQLKNKCSVILITTDKVYHNNEWQYPYREEDRLGGYDPYSASKACAELVIASYRNSFFNPVKIDFHNKALAVARAGNVIGGGDWSKDRLIPDIVKSLYQNKTISIRNPKSVRPWQHVIEPLFGYLELGKCLYESPAEYSKEYNFGPHISDTFSVHSMVEKSIDFWGVGNYSIDQNSNNPHEAGLLKLDISRALTELNWKPIFNAEIAINRTISWYKDYYNGISAKELVENDIEFYISLL
jgi:CDP-glucose 4,6-dehydratase